MEAVQDRYRFHSVLLVSSLPSVLPQCLAFLPDPPICEPLAIQAFRNLLNNSSCAFTIVQGLIFIINTYSLPLQGPSFYPTTLRHPSYYFTMNNIRMSYHNWNYRVDQLYTPTGEDKGNLLIRISMLSKYGGSGQANTYKANNYAIT